MTDSLRLGRIAGVPFGVHWSLLVFALLAVWNLASGYLPVVAPGAGSSLVLATAVLGVLGLFASIVAHELGHAVVARRHGVVVDGITLWMLGGVARLQSEPPSARAAGLVAAAGPAVSVGLGVTFGVMAVAASALGATPLLGALLAYLAAINVALALFNLIPALPLDGGRLYQAWLWRRDGDRHGATIKAARLGRMLGWALVVFGLFQVLITGPAGFWLVLLGSFVVSLAGVERRRARAEQQAERLRRFWLEAASPIIDVRPQPTAPPPG